MQNRAKTIQPTPVICKRCSSSMFLDGYGYLLYWHCIICGNIVFIPDEQIKKKKKIRKYTEEGKCLTCGKTYIKYKSDQYLCSECSKKGKRYYKKVCEYCNKVFYAKFKYAKYCQVCLPKIRSIQATRRINGKNKSY